MAVLNRKIFITLLCVIGMVYILGAFLIEVMEVDSAQYASMAMEMLESGNWLKVQHHYSDYLDKPPLLFWLSALSYTLFGLSPFAFRLPSLLFTLLGVYSTYRLGKLYYGKDTGLLAALFLLTCQAWFMFNHDVRTDTMLSGAVIFGVWQLFEYLRFNRPGNFILAFLGIALAMLAKGPIGIVVPVMAVGGEILYKKQWNKLFKWEWLLGIVLILLCLSPMLWGLYKQYGWEGPKFYFWTQSFGRITGESSWKDSTGYFYFTHTFLWAFMPWMVISVYALVRQLIALFKNEKAIEIFSLAGFILPIVALSFSHFKLPHYIFVAFPFAAILTAHGFVLTKSGGAARRSFFSFHIFMNLILWFTAGYLCLIAFPLKNIFLIIPTIGFFLASILSYFYKNKVLYPVLLPTLVTIIGINFILNTHFYPNLLKYQSGTAAGKYAKDQGIPPDQVYSYKGISFALDFQMEKIVPDISSELELRSLLNSRPTVWIYTLGENLTELQNAFDKVQVVETFDHFHVTLLSTNFLNPNTRPGTLRKSYLVRIDDN